MPCRICLNARGAGVFVDCVCSSYNGGIHGLSRPVSGSSLGAPKQKRTPGVGRLTVLPGLSIVIAIYNEAESLAPLLDEIRQVAGDAALDSEMIVVDDGSTDMDWDHFARSQPVSPALRVLHHDGNFGQSAGVLSGARAAQADWIVTLDGDGQNVPADIPALIVARDRHAASPTPLLIAGRRTTRKDNWLRRFSSQVANDVRRWILKDDCTDTGCGLKLFRREDFLALPHFDHLHRFLPALFKRAGGTVINVPVRHRPRECGISKYGVHNRLWVGFTDLFGVWWLLRRPCRPRLRD